MSRPQEARTQRDPHSERSRGTAWTSDPAPSGSGRMRVRVCLRPEGLLRPDNEPLSPGRRPNGCLQPSPLLPLSRAWKGVGTRMEQDMAVEAGQHWGPSSAPTPPSRVGVPQGPGPLRRSPARLQMGLSARPSAP